MWPMPRSASQSMSRLRCNQYCLCSTQTVLGNESKGYMAHNKVLTVCIIGTRYAEIFIAKKDQDIHQLVQNESPIVQRRD